MYIKLVIRINYMVYRQYVTPMAVKIQNNQKFGKVGGVPSEVR